MLNSVAKRLTKHLVDAGVVSSDLDDIYIYGFEVLITSLLSTLLIFIAGIALGRIVETISFLIVFIGLRSFTGGFHANTYWLCTALTLSIYVSVMLLSMYVKVPNIVYWLLLPIGVIVLLVKAPVRNPNKYLTDNETVRHKIVSIILFVAIMLAGALLLSKSASISGAIYYTLLADLILMFVKTHYVTNE